LARDYVILFLIIILRFKVPVTVSLLASGTAPEEGERLDIGGRIYFLAGSVTDLSLLCERFGGARFD
jgi:hypothetical protein